MPQLQAVSGPRRRRPGYVDQINAQRQFLPQLIQQKAAREQLAADQGLKERGLGLQERQLGIESEANKLTASQIAEQARANQAQSQYNTQNINLAQRGLDYQREAAEKGAGLEGLKMGINMAGKAPFGADSNMPSWVKTSGNILAPAATGGIAGWGAGKLLGGKSKAKKLMFGTGAGLLSGIMGGNWGKWGSMAGSGFGGLLGGLFS